MEVFWLCAAAVLEACLAVRLQHGPPLRVPRERRSFWCGTSHEDPEQCKNGTSCPFGVALCKLQATHGHSVTGELLLYQMTTAGPVHVAGTLAGLPPGKHHCRIHEGNSTGEDCKAVGPHFSPGNHGKQTDDEGLAGDLGNILADDRHVAPMHVVDRRISLVHGDGSFVVGRSIVIRAEELKGHDAEGSQALACCVITHLSH